MKALILAGGSGTRLWPLSRTNRPKQFLKFDGKESFLQKTIKRHLGVLAPEDIFVITNQDYLHDVKQQLIEIDALLENNIILEPSKKNTAPAIALGLKYIQEKCFIAKDEVIFISPADHLITPLDKYQQYLKDSEKLAKEGSIVTFGVRPTRPETGYGYIQTKHSVKDTLAANVERFVEKPSLQKAQEYLLSGDYFWNSGMFAFTFQTFWEELGLYSQQIIQQIEQGFENAVKDFNQMPDISIDYAVMEKSQKAVVLPLDLTWSDIGSWENVYEVLDKDENNNATLGEVLNIDSKNSLILGGKRLIATIGLEDMLVIETDDVVLIAKKDQSQKVKQLVQELQKNGRREAREHLTTERPWGSYTILGEASRYKIKKITVHPKHKLSLQMHFHRSEHWVVVKGTAKVTIGENEKIVHEGESIFVPKSATHRVENPGIIPLEIIEVQVGEYLGEDDIVRFEDIYGRLKK